MLPSLPVRARRGLAALFAALLVLAPAIAFAGEAVAAPPFDVEKALIDLLTRRPELVRNALAEMTRRDEEAKATAGKAMLKRMTGAIYDTKGSTVLGNPNGDVTVVVFLDYHCPYCHKIEPTLEALIQKDRGVRILIKQLPILGPGSTEAARMMLVNGQNDRTPRLQKALMAATVLDPPTLAALRKEYHVASVTPPQVDAALDEVRALSTALGIEGTPAVIIGEILAPGAIDDEPLARLVMAQRALKTAHASL